MRITSGLAGLVLLPLSLAGCSPPSSSPASQSVVPVSRASIEALVSSVTAGRASVVETFEGPDQLIGVVIQGVDQPKAVVWVTSSGRYLVAGNVYDISQRNLTTIAGSKFGGIVEKVSKGGVDQLPPMSKEQFYDATVAAPSLAQGDGDRHLYVYFDPDCHHCKLLYRSLIPALEGGSGQNRDVAIHWIPVGISNNAGRAAGALLAPIDAIDGVIRDGDVVASDDPDALAAIANNTRLLAASGRAATPTLVYRGIDGKVDVISGRPQGKKLREVLRNIAGAGGAGGEGSAG